MLQRLHHLLSDALNGQVSATFVGLFNYGECRCEYMEKKVRILSRPKTSGREGHGNVAQKLSPSLVAILDRVSTASGSDLIKPLD